MSSFPKRFHNPRPADAVTIPADAHGTSRARARAKNVQCGEEMIYYRPSEPKEIQTKTSKRDDFIKST